MPTRGPLFSLNTATLFDRMKKDIRQKVADKGVDTVRSALSGSIRVESTGRAIAAITTTDQSTVYTTDKYSMTVGVGPDETAVTTDLVSYGPWLEGSGSRNETTKFKGYHSFTMAGQELDGVAQGIADEAIQPIIRELNG